MKKESWIRWVKKERLNNQKKKRKTSRMFDLLPVQWICVAALLYKRTVLTQHRQQHMQLKEKKRKQVDIRDERERDHERTFKKHLHCLLETFGILWMAYFPRLFLFFHVLQLHVSFFYWLLLVHFCINKLLNATLLRTNTFSSIIYIYCLFFVVERCRCSLVPH